MNMNLYRVELPLTHPFTIFRGTLVNQPSLYVELEQGGITGYGEVTEDSYYGHTFESITASLEKARGLLERLVTENPLELWEAFRDAMEGDRFALSGLDIAAHDWFGKRLGQPCWEIWGLDWEGIPESSYTIGIDSVDKMVAKLRERPDWGIYKIKLGTGNDLEIVRRLREETDAVFRVDANCGWQVDEAIANSKELQKLGVQFIEQPLPPEASEADKRRLYSESALPIVADEDCQVETDVARCQGLYHGVNVKVSKCGGLTPALQMLREARQLGMKTMVGCMIESSVGISGAAQLLPLLDYVDLDGAVLLRDEPASGVTVERGQIGNCQQPGCGAHLDHNRLANFELSPK